MHNDYPLAPQKIALSNDMLLLNYCQKIADKFGIKAGDVKKLVPNLGSKTNYVLHYVLITYLRTKEIFSYICHSEWNWLKFTKSWDLNNLIGWKFKKNVAACCQELLPIVLRKAF